MSEAVVHIVDDEAALRGALALLARSVGLKARTYATASEFLEAYRPGGEGCLVVDVRMPGMSGIDLLERLRGIEGALPAIVMTGHGEVPLAVRAMRAGAIDFIEKPFQDQRLIDLIFEGIRLSADRSARRAAQAAARERIARLTPREREVLVYLVEGMLNKVIADRLGISPRTVELHRSHIMDKAEVGSLSELVRLALKAGIGEAES